MKRALVIAFTLVLGLGVWTAVASPFSGSWDTRLIIDWDTSADPVTINLAGFESILHVDYTVGGWTFGTWNVLDNAGLSQMWFDAAGALGAFSFTSIIEFNPVDAVFVGWENIGEVSIGGVDFYGLFDLYRDSVTGDISAGWAFGGLGSAGEASFGAEIQFGAGGGLYFAKLYGVQGAYGAYDGWRACSAWSPLVLAGNGTGADCSVGFTGFTAFAEFPFTCLDVTLFADFSCELGFDQAVVLLENIDLGAGWFNIDSLAVTFQTGSKTVCMDLDLTLGEAVCVTPYLRLITDPTAEYKITGVELHALTLEYNYNGVTFKAGDIFDRTWERESGWINAYTFGCGSMGYDWYFTPTGGITYHSDCAFQVEYQETTIYPNEMFGVSIDGDSCCGGAYDVDLYTFFVSGGDDGEYGIFGWLGTYGAVSVGIGSNFTIGANMTVSYLGMESIELTFGFTW